MDSKPKISVEDHRTSADDLEMVGQVKSVIQNTETLHRVYNIWTGKSEHDISMLKDFQD